jgi:hypothetical protein
MADIITSPAPKTLWVFLMLCSRCTRKLLAHVSVKIPHKQAAAVKHFDLSLRMHFSVIYIVHLILLTMGLVFRGRISKLQGNVAIIVATKLKEFTKRSRAAPNSDAILEDE